jgi:hypothetical protein
LLFPFRTCTLIKTICVNDDAEQSIREKDR